MTGMRLLGATNVRELVPEMVSVLLNPSTFHSTASIFFVVCLCTA